LQHQFPQSKIIYITSPKGNIEFQNKNIIDRKWNFWVLLKQEKWDFEGILIIYSRYFYFRALAD
jgi:hypothetical protein